MEWNSYYFLYLLALSLDFPHPLQQARITSMT